MAESSKSGVGTTPDFFSELLSPSELFAARSRSHKIPTRGQKEFLPDGSAGQRERLQQCVAEQWNLISEERVERLGALVKAEWIPSRGVVELISPAGKFWQTMGFSDQGKQFLLPEEALYLMECGTIQVFLHDLPLSIQEGYEMFLSQGPIDVQQYQVYSHLKRLGYVVIRFEPSAVPSVYERQLNLPLQRERQGRHLKRKRSSSPPSRLADGQVGSEDEPTETPDRGAKNQKTDPTDPAVRDSEFESEGQVRNESAVMESSPTLSPAALSGQSWWTETGVEHTPSPTRPQHRRWDWAAISFPNLGARRSPATLAAPDPALLPGRLSVGTCSVAPWLDRLNLRAERLSQREREQNRHRRSVNDDQEVRRCTNWVEYQELLRKRRSKHDRRNRAAHPSKGEVAPLLQPGQCASPGDVLDKISVVKPARLLDGTARLKELPEAWKISFDIFQPDTVAEFKKSNPGKPYSRLCVCRFDGPVPDLCTLKQLALQSRDTPVTIAVVDHGDISFYCFKDFQLPTDVSH